jgi:hypothetical protein
MDAGSTAKKNKSKLSYLCKRHANLEENTVSMTA